MMTLSVSLGCGFLRLQIVFCFERNTAMPRGKTNKQTTLCEEDDPIPRAKREQECVFCQIAKKKLDSYVVFEDGMSLAFLDSRPLFLGHTLLVPKQHYVTISDLPPALVGPYFTNAKLIATAIERGLKADGSFLGINNKISQSVPHLHIHIVPRRSGDGLRGFFYPRQKYGSAEEAKNIQLAITSAISELQEARGDRYS
jgi:histidine triad (HIT) family protein